MNEGDSICRSCGQPLAPDVPFGLCPRCLTKSAFGTGDEPGAAPFGFLPPPLEEVAEAFPQFEILELVGKGGMGAVYKARQPALDRWVALKILPPQIGNDPGFAERFNREARTLARLNHPGIVAIYDFGKAGTFYYLVMEYVDGMNLRQIERGGALSPRQALDIVPQICDALQFAHDEGIVHRDIKPENILVDKRGRVKITDFGIAKIMGATPEKIGLTGGKDIIGTPHYMAPEQIEKPNTVDHRADIYSLGVVFYELLTGELPLGKFPAPSSKVQVDVRLDEVVLRALEKDPARRYQQATEVKTATQHIAANPMPPPFQPKPSNPTPPPMNHSTEREWNLALIIPVLAILLLFGAATFLFAFVKARQRLPENAQASAAPPVPVSAPASPTLRYRWVAGENYVYAVQFQRDTEEMTETMAGNVIYNVQETNNGIATLSYRTSMGASQIHAKSGRLPIRSPFHFWAPPTLASLQRIKVDSTGKIQERSGQTKPLPQALGNAEELIFEPLPASNQPSWTAETDCVISQSLEPRSMAVVFRPVKRTVFPAHEKTDYQMIGTSNGLARIHKQYDLRTDEQVDGRPRMQLTGEGTITFDMTAGLPRSMEFKGLFTETSSNTTWRTPLTVSYRLLEGREKTNALAPHVQAKAEPKELTTDQLQDTLRDLKSANNGRQQLATATLARAKPTGPRDEVVNALLPLLRSSNWAVRQNAAKALGVWATANAYQPLIEMQNDPEFSVRWAVIEALGHWKDAPTATVLARHLASGADMSQASQTLRTIGQPAEGAVDGLLEANDRRVRAEACRILNDIGTKKSIPLLSTAAEDADQILATQARNALSAIENRH